jgi:hypothetical protein
MLGLLIFVFFICFLVIVCRIVYLNDERKRLLGKNSASTNSVAPGTAAALNTLASWGADPSFVADSRDVLAAMPEDINAPYWFLHSDGVREWIRRDSDGRYVCAPAGTAQSLLAMERAAGKLFLNDDYLPEQIGVRPDSALFAAAMESHAIANAPRPAPQPLAHIDPQRGTPVTRAVGPVVAAVALAAVANHHGNRHHHQPQRSYSPTSTLPPQPQPQPQQNAWVSPDSDRPIAGPARALWDMNHPDGRKRPR